MSSSSSSSSDETSVSDCDSEAEVRRHSYSNSGDADEDQDKIYVACNDEDGRGDSDGSSSADGENEGEESDDEKNIDGESTISLAPERLEAPQLKRKKPVRIFINLDHCDYPVFSEVCIDMGWKIATGRTRWNIKWVARYLLGTTIKDMRLRAGQRINHFPAVSELAFKCKLANNLNRVRKLLPAEYSFHPDTWVLPDEMHSFTRVTTDHKNRTYIIKPNGGSQVHLGAAACRHRSGGRPLPPPRPRPPRSKGQGQREREEEGSIRSGPCSKSDPKGRQTASARQEDAPPPPRAHAHGAALRAPARAARA